MYGGVVHEELSQDLAVEERAALRGFSFLLKLQQRFNLPKAVWWVALRVCAHLLCIAGTVLDVAEALLVEATVAW